MAIWDEGVEELPEDQREALEEEEARERLAVTVDALCLLFGVPIVLSYGPVQT